MRPRVFAAPGGALFPVHMLDAFCMFGQWWLVPEGAARWLGAFVVEWFVGVVDVLDDAALAIVAPPPTSAPVTTAVVIRDFSLGISFLTSILVLGTTPRSRPRVRGG